MSESLPIVRTFDAPYINALVNEPTIRPFVGGDGKSYLDLRDAVENKDNIFVTGEHGAFAFSWSAPAVYEVHTFIQPAGRGVWSRAFAKAARAYMADMGAEKLWTRVPVDAANVQAFTQDAGFAPCGSQKVDLGAGPETYDLYQWGPLCQSH